ncbi:hypothetical protein SAMN02910384_03187 [Pseudobutyrivibrio sp. ACV-2]|uniref:hypothetical protein n=1 Tax=Pseudobutyrivibrio sp. ACV-2 TaxID=1520801 RepID=UPI000899696E|nr:hypothetical protein [Pseudobutyrivibrio sp. ACV-2]SEB04303.1 hypothetical protein SAMN02910384_03187 [Pseudobutyrivibrio sp. ACV-2]
MGEKTPAEIERKIVDEYERNYVSASQLSEKYRCCNRTIYNILKRNGVQCRPQGKIPEKVESKVIDLYCKQKLSIYAISDKLDINSVTVYNALSRNGVKMRTNGGIDALPVDELVTHYKNGKSCSEIALLYGVTEHTITNYLQKEGIERDNRYKNTDVNVDYFENVDTADKAYFAGFMFTDGNVGDDNSIRITVAKRDIEILKIFNKYTNNMNQIKETERIRENRRNTIEVSTCFKSEKTKNDLCNLGIVPRKTYYGKPKMVANKLLSHMIRGMIDGDGWISSRGHNIGFCGNEYAVKFVHDVLVDKLGVYDVKIIKRKGKHLWQVQWCAQEDIRKIGEYIYRDKGDCYLSRKYHELCRMV